MKPYPIPENEPERLSFLEALGIDFSEPLEALQGLARVASHIAETPIALVSLVGEDEQRFAANVGLPGVNATSREVSFCAHTLEGCPSLVVSDARSDPRFAENALVQGAPNIRAYAGHALEPEPGMRVGALCVIDDRPRQFDPDVIALLEDLSLTASMLLTSHRDRRDLAEQLDAETLNRQAIERAAKRDPLTGVLTQAAFRATVDQVLSEGAPKRLLAIIDVDHFKQINDRLGHTFGDQYLIEIARNIEAAFGEDATVGRIGGDEFAVLLPVTTEDERHQAIDAMRVGLRLTANEFGQSQLGRFSMGLSPVGREQGMNFETLYQRADIALFAAKESGRNKATLYTPELDAIYNLRSQRIRFANALAEGHIEPFFQPKVDFASGNIVSFEVLVRWRDPEIGVIEPSAFSRLLTDRASAPDLTYQMIGGAVAAKREWQAQGAPSVRFAVNLTVHDLSDRQFVDDLDWRIKEAGLHWSDFTFEVTETVIMGSPDGEVYRSMCRIRERGGEVSLDDFGTGFAGLAHLRDWPIDSVKIDREFVRGMAENPKDDTIVASIISLAHRLDLEVVAEGIETQVVAERLHALGCDRGQGYFYSRPVDSTQALAILMAQDTAPATQNRA